MIKSSSGSASCPAAAAAAVVDAERYCMHWAALLGLHSQPACHPEHDNRHSQEVYPVYPLCDRMSCYINLFKMLHMHGAAGDDAEHGCMHGVA